jgi:hypothetical protein
VEKRAKYPGEKDLFPQLQLTYAHNCHLIQNGTSKYLSNLRVRTVWLSFCIFQRICLHIQSRRKNPTRSSTCAKTQTIVIQSFRREAEKTALFWAIAQQVAVIPYRRFTTTYRSRFPGWRLECCPVKMGLIDDPDTSVRTDHYSLRNSPEQRSSLSDQNVV